MTGTKTILGIIAFLITVFFMHLVFGTKATFYFTGIVLISILFLNADKLKSFSDFLKGGLTA